jgi:glyoxylase-like metal-dependent hydrolase (beta-lactamase superfamily II)
MKSIPLKFRLLKVGHCMHPECIAMQGGSWSGVRFPALCGLIEHPQHGAILFDTGYSHHFLDATSPFPERLYRWVTPVTLEPQDSLLSQLALLGLKATDIRHVIISHYHGDHVAGLKDFPNARFLSMRADYDQMCARSRLTNLLGGCLPRLLPHDFHARIDFAEDARAVALPGEFKPFDIGFDLFGDGSLIGVPLPGHARGQMGLALRQLDDRPLFLVADACWSRDALRLDRQPTWIAGRLFDSTDRYRATFQNLRALALRQSDVAILPSHCEKTWKAWPNEIS